MAITLKSVLLNLRSRLAFKTLVFGISLIILKTSGFSIWSVILFLVLSAALYSRPIFQTFFYIYQFAILISLILLLLPHFSGFYFWGATLGFSLLFYFLLELKNLVFIDRLSPNYLIHFGLIYGVLLAFFLENFEFFIFKSIILFFTIGILLSGILKGKLIWGFLPALLISEAAVFVSWLPLGFLQSANFVFVISWFLADTITQYRQKILTIKTVFRSLLISILLIGLIFLTSGWSF